MNCTTEYVEFVLQGNNKHPVGNKPGTYLQQLCKSAAYNNQVQERG